MPDPSVAPSDLPAQPAPPTRLERQVRGWLAHQQVERGAAANTVAAYRRDLRRYAAYLADAGVTDAEAVTPAHVAGFLAALREGDATHRPLAAASAARTLVAVRGLHKFLTLDGMTTSDPAREVAPPRAALRLPKAIAVDEVERLIGAAGGDDPVMALRDGASTRFTRSGFVWPGWPGSMPCTVSMNRIRRQTARFGNTSARMPQNACSRWKP